MPVINISLRVMCNYILLCFTSKSFNIFNVITRTSARTIWKANENNWISDSQLKQRDFCE